MKQESEPAGKVISAITGNTAAARATSLALGSECPNQQAFPGLISLYLLILLAPLLWLTVLCGCSHKPENDRDFKGRIFTNTSPFADNSLHPDRSGIIILDSKTSTGFQEANRPTSEAAETRSQAGNTSSTAEPHSLHSWIKPIDLRILENSIVLAADAWPPYNFEENSPHPGFLIDLATEIFVPSGFRVIYMVMPWKRALEGTLKGYYDGAVAASKIEGPDLIFPQTPVLINKVSFFTVSPSQWVWENDQSIDNLCLGVAGGYDYNTFINNHISENRDKPEILQELAGARPIHQNIAKLMAGRIDVIAGNRGTIEFIAGTMNLSHQIRFAGTDNRDVSPCYFGFTPARDRGWALAQIMDAGLKRVKASGKWETLLRKYGLTEKEISAEEGSEDK